MKTITVAAPLLGALAIAGLAACAPATVTAVSSAPAAPPVPPASAPAPSASPSPSATAASLGTTFEVTSENTSDGSPVTYRVTLDKVDQDAQLGAYQTPDNPSDHMAAAEFTVTGVTGQASDDVNSDAVALDGDTSVLQASFDDVSDGGNFNSGTWSVGPGETQSGWAAFEVPSGQKVTAVQWQADDGFGGSSGQWNLGS
jgi:hypothetical protein